MVKKEVVKLGYVHPNVNMVLFHHLGRFTLKNLYSFYTENWIEKDALYYPIECMNETFRIINSVKVITECKVVKMQQNKINLYLTKSKMIGEYVPDILTKEEYVKEYKEIYPAIEQKLKFMIWTHNTGDYRFVLLTDNRVLEKKESQYYLVGTLKEKDVKELVMMLYEYTQQERKNMIQIRALDLRGSKVLQIS